MDERDYARLLSGREEPSILEKEAVLARVLARTGRRERPRWAASLALAALAASVCGVLLVVRGPAGDAEFAARGSAGPTLDVVCAASGGVGRCPAGETIAFDVRGSATEPYAALLARAEDGTIVWFFPREGARSETVPATTMTVLDRGIRLGDTLPPGRHAVYLVLTKEPLDRAGLKARLASGFEDVPGVRIVRRSLVVEGRP